MAFYSTTIATKQGSKYLRQLCKHFAHKVEVDYSPSEGRALLPPGPCLMRADATSLQLYFKAREEAGISVIQHILDDHLIKFAWRETLSYEWSAGAPEDIGRILSSDAFLTERCAR